MPLHEAVWAEYLERFGIDTAGLTDRMHGKRNDELVRDLFGDGLDEETVFAHGAAKEALFRQRLEERLTESLVPGIDGFLARESGCPKAVGSNAEPANVAFVLDRTGLRRHFDALVDGHQVERPKPHPDIYLRAAALLGRAPGECIVFEDSPTGITAGRAAGMRVVAVNTARLAAFEGVDLVIDDFRSPELERWLSTQQSATR